MNDNPRAATFVFSVSALVGAARELLEAGFSGVAVEGEVSNLARPRSGHVYFTLKDENAQLRCALFRREAREIGFPLADGLRVLAHGRLSIYPQRGEFQLYVASLEEAGLGALQRAFEALKRRLAAEGLFDESVKRALPRYPTRIGVVTSPTGAALRDILKVLAKRYRPASVLIYPVPVQGEAAAGAIVHALELASARRECDVLILARGGGSLEDLWPFNEEVVARAIRGSSVPVVSGVGHETDFTIADFAADLRAPTPSAAAAAIVPEAADLLMRLAHWRERLRQAWQRDMRERHQNLTSLDHRLSLRHPRRRIEERAQRLDELGTRLAAAARRSIQARRAQLATSRADLQRLSPAAAIARLRLRFDRLAGDLRGAMLATLAARRTQVATLNGRLLALGPQQTLARGYAILFDERGRVLRQANQVRRGARIRARLARGSLSASVDEVQETPE